MASRPSYITDNLDAGEAAAALETRADGPSDKAVAELRGMGETLAAMDAGLAALEIAGEVLRGRRRELATRIIPDRMMELRVPSVGMPSITRERWLADGAAVLTGAVEALRSPSQELLDSVKVPEDPVLRLEDFVSANIAADWDPERRAAAFEWLVKSGNGGLIKVQMKAAFARGDRKLFERAMKAFRKSLGKKADSVTVEINEAVPHGTLAAFVRTELEQGHEVPLQLLGATAGKVAKLGRDKARRK